MCRIPTGIAFTPKSERSSAHPALTRGAFRDRHERWERDAMDAARQQTNDVTRTAKSCGPGAPTLALSERNDPLTTVARKPGSPRRSRISRKTIAQGMPVAPAEPVVLPRAFLLHADHGCSPHPAFPAPSSSDEGGLLEKLGRIAPRERGLTSRSAVMPRFKRGTQYSRGVSLKRCDLWNTGSPGHPRSGRGQAPGEDSGGTCVRSI
jgi:hypothetical protein